MHDNRSLPLRMITNVSLVTIYVQDQDRAKAFYTDMFGFVVTEDVTMGDYRWLAVNHPDHPELMLTLTVPGPPLDPEAAETVKRLQAKGAYHGVGLATDDCRKTFEELSAKGVEFLQEPSDRPYGVEAVCRDDSGNWIVLVEQRTYAKEELAAWAETAS